MKNYRIAAAAIVTLMAGGITLAQTPSTQPAATNPQTSAAATAPAKVVMPELTIGSTAPTLKVAKWFKGTPVEGFKPGQVYVIEFWATWCGPCRESIPHLTELSKKFAGKATFVGISVSERPEKKTDDAIFALVEPFIKEMGDKMDYNVAADGIDHATDKAWMQAAQQDGIPTAFIINQETKVAWIGHPMEMEAALDQVIKGTFDIKAEYAKQEKIVQDRAEEEALLKPIEDAIKAKDDKGMVTAIDAVLKAKPDLESDLMPLRLSALVAGKDEAAAFGYLKALVDKGFFKTEPGAAMDTADIILSRADTMKNPDFKLLAAALEQANQALPNEPPLMVALAEAQFRAGDSEKAVATQKSAIAKAMTLGDRVPKPWLDAQNKKLAEYQAKKN